MSLRKGTHDSLIALKGADLSLPQKSMYIYICDVCTWGKGRFTKKQQTIADDLGMPMPTVQKYLKDLSGKNYILKVSHYQNYGSDKPFRTNFIYPLKYYKELFKKSDALKILGDTVKEVDRIKEKSEDGIKELYEILDGLRKEIESMEN